MFKRSYLSARFAQISMLAVLASSSPVISSAGAAQPQEDSGACAPLSSQEKGAAAGHYAIGAQLVADGLPQLAYFSMDRAVRAENNGAVRADRNGAVRASGTDQARFAALDCIENLQSNHATLDLPNYDQELPALVSAAKKSPANQAILARFAFRSVVQRIGAGNLKSANFSALQPALKISALGSQAADGLTASAQGEHAKAVKNLRAALANPSVGDLKSQQAGLRLALARSLYALGDDAAAISEYERLYQIGLPMQDALIESAWAQLRAKNYVKSIGLSYELTTGKLSQFFAPEALSIRAISFLENCRYSETRKVIEQFTATYTPISAWIRETKKSDQSLYETAIARSEGALGKDSVPEKVWSVWTGSDVFTATQNGITKAFAESRQAAETLEDSKYSKSKARLTADLKLLEAARTRAAARIEEHLERLNASMGMRIDREVERLKFVRIEANQGAGRDLIYRNANPEMAEMEKRRIKADRAEKSYRGKLDWGKVEAEDPATETWIDEIGNFEAKSLDRCKAKKEYQDSKK
ncbi:MAG: hypothetical protein H7301_11980 [Cryobacterium sp.]|nr:hypothetical protein [Oligoflexia bacterium]